MNHRNNLFPTPLPEPPRVVSTRLTVPDLSISSDIDSTCFKSKQKQENFRKNARFETPFPRKSNNEFVSPRQPLKASPIINRYHSTNRSEMDVADMLKQHDQQLQLISKQIEKLLQLTSDQKPKPSTCSVETMTSNVWPTASKAKECTKRKCERVQEVSFESRYSEVEDARGGENSDEYYERILTNIDEMLNSSGSDGNATMSEPVIEERIIHKRDRTGRESAHQMSSETLYIKRLASKYLICERESPPVVERNKKSSYRPKMQKDLQVYGIAQEVSSVATKNYLQKYGLVNRPQDFSPSQGLKTVKKGNRILDLENLKRQPKFV